MTANTRRAQLEAMLADAPNDPELRYMVAMEYVSESNDEAAARCFDELIRTLPNYPPAYHMAGRTLQRLGRIAEARDVLQRGIPVALGQRNDHAAGEMQELLAYLDSA